LNRDMCKFESSQKDESRWQSTDSSRAYRNTSALSVLSSVFLMEMFDFRGKELKYAKELLLNHYRKSTFYEVPGHVGRVKNVVTNHLPYLFEYNEQNFIPKTPTQSSVRIISEILDFYAFTPEGT